MSPLGSYVALSLLFNNDRDTFKVWDIYGTYGTYGITWGGGLPRHFPTNRLS